MTARRQLAVTALAAALAVLLGAPLARGDAPAADPASGWREASLAGYRQHLVELNAVVEACAKTRERKSCDPTLVGQDDHVPLSDAPNAERRLVSYNWLRVLLAKAQEKDAAPEKREESLPSAGASVAEATRPPKPTTGELLQAAQQRLAQEITQADEVAAGQRPATTDDTRVRETMKQVLAGRDFRNLEAPTARDSALEKLSAWLNQLIERIAKLRSHAAWVGGVIVGGFILAVCVGLAWGLLQLERRWRIRLTPESGETTAADAASARNWQLWLKDARLAADAAAWREAIHSIYWAAISRLESKRLWPADRARTPREYLALVAAEDPRRTKLAALTGSFERSWYGGRATGESDYRKAEELASALISGGGAKAAGPAAEAAEGGAR